MAVAALVSVRTQRESRHCVCSEHGMRRCLLFTHAAGCQGWSPEQAEVPVMLTAHTMHTQQVQLVQLLPPRAGLLEGSHLEDVLFQGEQGLAPGQNGPVPLLQRAGMLGKGMRPPVQLRAPGLYNLLHCVPLHPSKCAVCGGMQAAAGRACEPARSAECSPCQQHVKWQLAAGPMQNTLHVLTSKSAAQDTIWAWHGKLEAKTRHALRISAAAIICQRCDSHCAVCSSVKHRTHGSWPYRGLPLL